MDGMKLGKRRIGHASLMLSHSKALPENLSAIVEISQVTTAEGHRRKGNATRLLKDVCNEADESGTVLMLMPDGEDWLTDWYEKHGFQTIQTAPLLMARPPRNA